MHNQGVRLAFDPIFDADGEVESYQLYLLNSTPHRILYELKLKKNGDPLGRKFGPLDAGGRLRYATPLPYAYLNERIAIELDVRAQLEGGTGPRHYQQLSLKARQFFGNLQPVPELGHDAHLYTVFPKLDATPAAKRAAQQGPSLRELTRQQLKKSASPETKAPASAPRLNSAAARAAFNTVLDLHLEALVDDPATVAKKDRLKTQLDAFEEFMEQALRLDVERVLIVHGLGNGILKTEIHARLPRVPFVKRFANDYHPKYGYGATEVIFE